MLWIGVSLKKKIVLDLCCGLVFFHFPVLRILIIFVPVAVLWIGV